MKKFFCLSLLVLVLAPEAVLLAQQNNRYMLPLNVIYKNKRTDRDTVATSDTVRIGIKGRGNLAPIGVVLQVTTEDADVSGTPDSLNVTYFAGIGNQYAQVGTATLELSALGTFSRTLVFNTTGAAVALNAQAAVWPYCDAIQLVLADGSLDTDDSLRYSIKASGIYEAGRIFVNLPVVYKNKSNTADSALGTTVDTLRVGVKALGDYAPLGVGITIKAFDADVSNFADSLLVASFGSIGRQTYHLGTSTFFGECNAITNGGSATGIRTYVFNTTGAATARNTQATVSPFFETLQLRLKADDSGDTTRYVVKALGIYQKQ